MPLTCHFSADKKYGYFGKNYKDSDKSGDPDTIDLSKLNNGDGVYEIRFGVKDVNGNEATSQTNITEEKLLLIIQDK